MFLQRASINDAGYGTANSSFDGAKQIFPGIPFSKQVILTLRL